MLPLLKVNIHMKLSISKRVLNLWLAIVLIAGLSLGMVSQASAAQITGRTLTLGSSVGGATTTYTLTFTVPSGTTLQSFDAEICTTASGACSTPGSFDASGATASQPTNLGDASGWSTGSSTTGKLKIQKTGNSAAPTGNQTVAFSGVVNPAATNSTFFARLTTYSDDAWATPVDTGTVAASTAGQITVTASVNETLTFTLASATVALGTLSTATTGSGTSTMAASTNAPSGYAITVHGNTLQSGANSISALASQTASSQGSSQFGINLKANATPSVGSDPSGGSGAATGSYGTADQFRFVTGDSVASAAGATNTTTYTVSYIANIAGVTPPGNYSTTLTYIATATF